MLRLELAALEDLSAGNLTNLLASHWQVMGGSDRVYKGSSEMPENEANRGPACVRPPWGSLAGSR